jgi:hypothetical protein
VPEALYADATDLLTRWEPTSAASAQARERTLELLAAGPVAMTRGYRPGHVTASALVLDATGSRLLLCLHGKFRMDAARRALSRATGRCRAPRS